MRRPAASGTAEPGAAVRVEALGKVYGRGLLRQGFRALEDVTLEVARGSVFGLLGPNGAGKTTLVKVLLGLVRGFEGRAQMLGRPVGAARVRRAVGYLPESHRLPAYLTGRQVLELFAGMCGVGRRDARRRVPELLERVGMTASADRKVREYSKGMQQRIGLAQALVHEPELVFLDEPTDGVDPVGRAAIRRTVLELRAAGCTIFVNSHLLAEVELVCDRVVILNRGRLVREGPIDELTPRTGAVRFELDRPRADLERLLAGLGRGLSVEGASFELVASDEEIDAAVDRLRAAGAGLRGLARRRLTLEESFLDLVREEAP